MALSLGIVVGLDQEAQLARLMGTVAIGGGTFDGAMRAAEVLVTELKATALMSFGIAGGLDPSLRPGDVLCASEIMVDGQIIKATLSAKGLRQGRILGARAAVAGAAEKAALWSETRAQCVDLESGAVALVARRHRIPFGAMRAICDPAERSLPPVALIALQDGSIRLGRVFGALLRRPGQLPALLTLAQDARKARLGLARLRLAPEGDGLG